jgi:heme-degrading monooxygenase HmoA
MPTIITRVRLRAGTTQQWDRAMHIRVQAARDAPGWVSAQLLKGLDDDRDRLIIGVWASPEAWAAWHEDDAFRATREELAGVEERPPESRWFDVVEDVD